MAITNGHTLIGLTATPLDGVWTNPSLITIHNNDNATDIFIGGSAVTVQNGLLLLKEQSYQFNLQPLEQIYAVSTKTGHEISWMRQTI